MCLNSSSTDVRNDHNNLINKSKAFTAGSSSRQIPWCQGKPLKTVNADYISNSECKVPENETDNFYTAGQKPELSKYGNVKMPNSSVQAFSLFGKVIFPRHGDDVSESAITIIQSKQLDTHPLISKYLEIEEESQSSTSTKKISPVFMSILIVAILLVFTPINPFNKLFGQFENTVPKLDATKKSITDSAFGQADKETAKTVRCTASADENTTNDNPQSPDRSTFDQVVVATEQTDPDDRNDNNITNMAEVASPSSYPSAVWEIMEMIVTRTSVVMIQELWRSQNVNSIVNTYRLLSSVCDDWRSLISQRSLQRRVRAILIAHDPLVFYSPKSTYIGQLSTELDVNGLAVCNDKLYVIGISSSVIEVYTKSSKMNPDRSLVVDVMTDPWNITACPVSQSLYVCESDRYLLQLDLNGTLKNVLKLDNRDHSAVKTTLHGTLIVTYSNRLVELDGEGRRLRQIQMNRNVISSASHAVSIETRRQYFVCHGSGSNGTPHLVCLIDFDGIAIRIHQEREPVLSAYQPQFIALADYNCYLVSNISRQTVQIFSSDLRHHHNLIHMNDDHRPLKVAYMHGCVYVSTLEGKIVVYDVSQMKDVSGECVDVQRIAGVMNDDDDDDEVDDDDDDERTNRPSSEDTDIMSEDWVIVERLSVPDSGL